jgi:multiple antibiotic resistance protein
MITPAFIFTIFMLTLGPIKTVPAFFSMAQNLAPSAARALALKGTMAAIAISLAIALVMTGVAASWRVSRDDLRIAGGILLFAASCEMIGRFNLPASSPPSGAAPAKQPAITPLATPTIVTPWGVTAILFVADFAYNDPGLLAIVIALLLIVMLLNLVGMLLARQFVARVGMIGFQVLGWIFAVLQAGFAVDAVVTSLRNLALFQPLP